MQTKDNYRISPMLQVLTFIACFMIAALSFAPGEAAEKGRKGTKRKTGQNATVPFKKGPIKISSDELEMDMKKSTVTYRGRVVVTQGEMTMKSQVLTGYYDSEAKEIKKIVANGKVHVTQEGRVATGAKAVFDVKEQTIILTGNPVMREGRSQISGSRFIFYIDQDRFKMEGPVKSILIPDELMEKKKKKKELGKK